MQECTEVERVRYQHVILHFLYYVSFLKSHTIFFDVKSAEAYAVSGLTCDPGMIVARVFGGGN